MNYTNYPYQNYQYYNYQPNNIAQAPIYTQAQANKQLVSLRQDQNSSNTIMCRILSELESLAFFCGYNGPKLFGYYATKPRNFQDIINQILFQMTIFESSYNNFKKHNPNKQYEYPNNLNFNDIVNIVNKWKSSVKTNNHSYEEYYNEFLNIISNNNLSKSFNNQFHNIDKNSPNITNTELRRIMNAGATAICYTNEKYDNIEKEIIEKGDYKVNVVLGGERKDNKFYSNMDQYDQNFDSLKKELYTNLQLMLGYLELYVLSKANKDHGIKIKYSQNIKDGKDNAYQKYSFYLDETDNIYNKIYHEFSYVIPTKEKEIFEKDLKLLKRNTNDPDAKKECANVIDFICHDKTPIKK